MNKIVLLLLIIMYPFSCYSQDMIFFKDGSTKTVKIKEVSIYSISYKKYEILNSPIYEVLISDVTSILYSNGDRDFFTTKDGSEKTINSSDTNNNVIKTIKYDSANYSIIYILYNYKMDESNRFPTYFNGQYICTLKNHSRLKYTMHSCGQLQIERRGIHAYLEGPTILLQVEPGKSYGINIIVHYSQALDPNKKFKYDVIKDSSELLNFINNKFYGFTPYKEDDFILQENKNSPLFK